MIGQHSDGCIVIQTAHNSIFVEEKKHTFWKERLFLKVLARPNFVYSAFPQMLNQAVASLLTVKIPVDSVAAIVFDYIEYAHVRVDTINRIFLEPDHFFELQDGQIALQTDTDECCIFNLETNRKRKRFGTSLPIDTMAIVGNWLVAYGSRGLHFFEVNLGVRKSLKLRFDVGYLAAGGENLVSLGKKKRTLCVWDVQTFKIIRQKKVVQDDEIISAFAVSPTGKYAALFCMESFVVRVINLATFAEEKLEGHTNYSFSMLFLSDTLLASSSADTTIKVWNVETKECLTMQNQVEARELFQMPCGTLLAPGKNGMNFWNPYTCKLLATHDFGIWNVRVCLRNGRILADDRSCFARFE